MFTEQSNRRLGKAGFKVVCRAQHKAIDVLADRAEAAESDLSRTTQLWKRALEDLKAAERERDKMRKAIAKWSVCICGGCDRCIDRLTVFITEADQKAAGRPK